MFPVLICWAYDYDEWIKFSLNQLEKSVLIMLFIVPVQWIPAIKGTSFLKNCFVKEARYFMMGVYVCMHSILESNTWHYGSFWVMELLFA